MAKLVAVSEQALAAYANSIALDDGTRNCLTEMVTHYGNSYVNFVHCLLGVHSPNYVTANSPDSPLDLLSVERALSLVRTLDPNIPPTRILIGDKMDLLYGSDYRSYAEYSKFDAWFYESAYNLVGKGEEVVDQETEELFESLVRAVEFFISTIEQAVIFNTEEATLDDTVVLCLLPKGKTLYFVLM